MSQLPDDTPLTVGTLRAVLRQDASLTKNGETWRQYLDKWITPQNLLLVVLAGFTIGGRVQQAQTDISEALKSNARLVMEIATLTDTVDTQQKVVDAQQASIAAQREMFATKANLEALQDRVRLNITRREFQEFQRSVLPALQRIEQSMESR